MNRITSLLGIQYPIVQGGMVWCSGWRLASAVSNAGGLGLIGAGSMHPEILREHIRKCRVATKFPFRYDLAEPFNNNIARVGLYGKSMKIKNRTMNVYKQPLYTLLIHLNADDILF